jgi:uncharacterized membrane protein
MTLAPLLEAAPVVQVHTVTALLAIGLGIAAWMRRTRDALHRALGWAWVVAMAVAAVSAAFIFQLRVIGPFSPIHLLIPPVLVALWRGVAHARAGRIAAHRRAMTALYVQALGIAGLFTLWPGRTMSRAIFSEAPWTGFLLSAAAFAAFVGWRIRRDRHRADPPPAEESQAAASPLASQRATR